MASHGRPQSSHHGVWLGESASVMAQEGARQSRPGNSPWLERWPPELPGIRSRFRPGVPLLKGEKDVRTSRRKDTEFC